MSKKSKEKEMTMTADTKLPQERTAAEIKGNLCPMQDRSLRPLPPATRRRRPPHSSSKTFSSKGRR